MFQGSVWVKEDDTVSLGISTVTVCNIASVSLNHLLRLVVSRLECWVELVRLQKMT